MRISFDDKSFIEIELSTTPGKVHVSIGARDADNILKINVQSAEITLQQLSDLVYSLNVQIPMPTLKNSL